MDVPTTEVGALFASTSAQKNPSYSALEGKSNKVTQQVAVGRRSATSEQFISARSLHAKSASGPSVRQFIPLINKNINTVEEAKDFIFDSEIMIKDYVLNINNRHGVTLPTGERIKPSQCLKLLSGMVSCLLICDRLDDAEKYINFLLNAVTSGKSFPYSQDVMGRIYFLKFVWCSKKINAEFHQQESVKESAKTALLVQPLKELSNAELQREMRHCLEAAIKLKNDEAMLAGVVYYLDDVQSGFLPCAKRGFELLEMALKKAESRRYFNPLTLGGKYTQDGVSIYLFLAFLLHSIRKSWSSSKSDGLGDQTQTGLELFSSLCTSQCYIFTESGCVQDYLTHRKEPGPLFLSFLGDREILLKYLRISPQVIFYTLARENKEQFHQVYHYFLDDLLRERDNMVFRTLSMAPAYHPYVYAHGGEKRHPESETDGCEFDPLILRDKLNYLYIKHKMKNREWQAAASVFDTLDLTTITEDQKSEYIGLLIKLHRLPDAIEQLKTLIKGYETDHRYYDQAMAAFKLEEVEELLVDDNLIVAFQSVGAEAVASDPAPDPSTTDDDKVDLVSVDEKSTEYSVLPSEPAQLELKKERQVTPASSLSLQRKKVRSSVPVFDYRAVCQKILVEMDYGSLDSTVKLIDEELKNPRLGPIHRGRLLWRKGWAYKALARNPEERGKALMCFSKALLCAVGDKDPSIRLQLKSLSTRGRSIDPVQFLEDEKRLSQWIHPECYLEKPMSLIADIYSATGNYFRDVGLPGIGGRCSGVADHIKPWRTLRCRYQPGNKAFIEPKVRLVKSKKEAG